MRRRQLTILAIGAIALVVLAVLTTTGRQEQQGSGEPELLVPGLQDRLNDVSRIVIQLDAAQRLTLERNDEGWTVAERGDYPANGGQLRKLLLSLSNTRLREEKTSNPDNYARLGVQELAEAGDNTRGVRLEAGDAVLADLIVGDTGRSGNSYVRRVGEQPSWLATEWLDVPGRASGWLDVRLLSVKATRVVAVDIAGAGPALTLQKADDGNWLLLIDGAPTAAKVEELARIARVLEDLTIDDLGSAAVTDAGWHTATFTTSDGLAVVVHSLSADDKLYARFEASATAAAASEVVDEAAAIQARVADRTFVLASYMKDRFAPDSANLVEPPAAE